MYRCLNQNCCCRRSVSTVETSADGKHFLTRFDPIPARGHCQVTVDDDTIMIFGGSLKSRAYKLTLSTGRWAQMPSMYWSRTRPACGLVNNGTAVVVAGGYLRSSVEVLDLRADPPKWKSGELWVDQKTPELHYST